jgi:hypothetical protein
MKSLVLIASLALVLGACTVRSDTVVQRPAPVPVAASSTTYVQPDAGSPTGVSSTTVYRN